MTWWSSQSPQPTTLLVHPLEIPVRLARAAKLPAQSGQATTQIPVHRRYCYRFDNTPFAAELRQIFDRLRDIADRASLDKSVRTWMEELIRDGELLAEQHIRQVL